MVVDNIPKVNPARQEKLKTVIYKLFSTFGDIVSSFYPLDEEETTKGYAFLDNHRLDKNHNFAVNFY